jgi:hypothetical protein
MIKQKIKYGHVEFLSRIKVGKELLENNSYWFANKPTVEKQCLFLCWKPIGWKNNSCWVANKHNDEKQ